MSKPESIKVEPWTDFPRQSYTIFTDDFVHDKLGVVKVNAKGEKSTANIKATLNVDKSGAKTISDEVKFWFSLSGNRALYAKIKSSNYLKVQYDHGVIEQFNRKWNIYGSINTNKSLEDLSLRIGASHLGDKCHSDNRLKIDFGSEERKNVTWYNRTLVYQNKFTFGLLGAYGISHNVVAKNNLLVGYKLDDKSTVFLRAQNDGYRKGAFDLCDWRAYFDTIKLDFVSSYQNNVKYGVETILKTRGPIFNEFLFVVQHYEDSQKLTTKLRLSSKFDASLLFKIPCPIFKNIATVSTGLHGSSLATEKRSFKYGAQIEFNV